MNIFVGIGKIANSYMNGRVLKFTLAVQQERPCFVPCLMFDPTEEVKTFVEQIRTSGQVISLQGKLSSSEYEFEGKTRRKLEVVVLPRNLKTV